jgi:hypothetical protein
VVKLYTGLVHDCDVNMVEIIVKSASTELRKLLAPTWSLVNAIKEGLLTPKKYDERWLELWWDNLMQIYCYPSCSGGIVLS